MFRFAAASSKPSTLAQTVIRLGAVAAACSALTWSLSGCGGGSRAKAYVPDSVVSFGDENSAMEDYTSSNLDPSASPHGSATKTIQGLRYTVNSVFNGLTVFGAATYCTDTTLNTMCSSSGVGDGTANSNLPISPVTEFQIVGTPVSNYLHGYFFDSVNINNVHNVVSFIGIGQGTYNSGASPIAMKQTYESVYACELGVLWNQIVAHNFGKGFQSQCARESVAGAVTYAQYGHKVADMASKVALHRGELHDGVLVTVMIGQNDILWVYSQVQASLMSDSAAQQELASRGAAAAAIVKDILSTGAKVVLALTPDLGQSPKAFLPTSENQSLLSAYTKVFNDAFKFGMGSTAAQDGRHFALVESDLFTNPITRSASYVHGIAVCGQTLTARPSNSTTVRVIRPDGTEVTANADPHTDDGQVQFCDGSTLIDGGSTATYMWADNIHFAPAGHAQVGSLAASRVYNQF